MRLINDMQALNTDRRLIATSWRLGQRAGLLEVTKRVCVLVSVLVASSSCVGGLERARQAGDEASAIGSVRAVLNAQLMFSMACGAGGYAPSLKVLATPPKQGGEGFIGPDLGSDPAVKSRYVISMTPGPVASELPESCNGLAAGRTTQSFFVTAVPAQKGGRFFATNAEMNCTTGCSKFYASTVPIPVTLSGPPPAPAVELK
jgi:hypothetical protein